MAVKISFITAVNNRAEELKEMIASLISQDFVDWESIIVDDNSTEPIKPVVDSFNDPRIKYLKLSDGLKGISNARNMAIENANAEILITADSDDVNRPERARKTYEIMSTENGDVFYCNLESFNTEKNFKKINAFQPYNEELYKMFNFMTGAGTAFRKSKVLKAGGYDPNFELSEDYDLILRILDNNGKVCYTSDVLVNYRRNLGSITVNRSEELHKYVQKTRIKNNIPPLDIKKAADIAIPELKEGILSEGGLQVWSDERFGGNK